MKREFHKFRPFDEIYEILFRFLYLERRARRPARREEGSRSNTFMLLNVYIYIYIYMYVYQSAPVTFIAMAVHY
jgi:hypothetical protein